MLLPFKLVIFAPLIVGDELKDGADPTPPLIKTDPAITSANHVGEEPRLPTSKDPVEAGATHVGEDPTVPVSTDPVVTGAAVQEGSVPTLLVRTAPVEAGGDIAAIAAVPSPTNTP
jgi:hypothetical protein